MCRASPNPHHAAASVAGRPLAQRAATAVQGSRSWGPSLSFVREQRALDTMARAAIRRVSLRLLKVASRATESDANTASLSCWRVERARSAACRYQKIRPCDGYTFEHSLTGVISRTEQFFGLVVAPGCAFRGRTRPTRLIARLTGAQRIECSGCGCHACGVTGGLASDAPAEGVIAREDGAGVAGRESQGAAWHEIGPTSAASGATKRPRTTSISSLSVRGYNINERRQNRVFSRDNQKPFATRRRLGSNCALKFNRQRSRPPMS